MSGTITSPPAWFSNAVAAPYEDHFIEVEGCRIHYLHWVDPERAQKPGLLFVHGGGAHAHWWSFIAPFFRDTHSVAAIDISGMGDSGHREAYPPATYARELISVCEAAGFGNDAVIVAHSFGGFGTIKTGFLYPDRLKGIMIVDTVVMSPETFEKRDETSTPFRPKKTYPDIETALSRFRLLPEQPCANHYIIDHIARHSLMPVEGGVMWKFDHEFNTKMDYRELVEDIPRLRCKRVVIHGAESIFFNSKATAWMQQLYGPEVPFIAVPRAQHHVFLDEPLAFIETVRGVLTDWDAQATPRSANAD